MGMMNGLWSLGAKTGSLGRPAFLDDRAVILGEKDEKCTKIVKLNSLLAAPLSFMVLFFTGTITIRFHIISTSLPGLWHVQHQVCREAF